MNQFKEIDESMARKLSLNARPSAPFNVRTSRRQFQIMIAFMEEQGDLCKLSLTSHKRITEWDRLRRMLNAAADSDGHPRSIDKWKKVWSDLKNNTKKKALRLVRTPGVAKGGLRLSQLEYRVLKVMDMIKTALPSGEPPPPPASLDMMLTPVLIDVAPEPPPDQEGFELAFDALSCKREMEPAKSNEIDDDMFSWPKSPSPKPDNRRFPEVSMPPADYAPFKDCSVPEICRPPFDVSVQQSDPIGPRPDACGHTTVRNVSARRRRGTRALERGAAALLRAEARWVREARSRRARDAALERARLRLRAEELHVQHEWQQICDRGLTLMQRFMERTFPAPASEPEVPEVLEEAEMEMPEEAEALEEAEVPEEAEMPEEAEAEVPGEAEAEVPGEAEAEVPRLVTDELMPPSRPLVLHPDGERCSEP